jgi:hypothetical protein
MAGGVSNAPFVSSWIVYVFVFVLREYARGEVGWRAAGESLEGGWRFLADFWLWSVCGLEGGWRIAGGRLEGGWRGAL